MRVVVLVLLLGLVAGCASNEPTTRADESGWLTYHNPEYGYRIRYPASFGLWETGPEGERDGASIRIARKNYAAPTPALDVSIGGPDPLLDEMADWDLVDMTVNVVDGEIAGRPAKVAESRWKANGELAFVEIQLEDAYFRFHASPGLHEFEGTVWWEVVSSYARTGEG